MRKALTITLLLFGRAALADVQLTNGDFHTQETDLPEEGYSLSRIYNSMSSHEGVFGKGWSCELETALVPGKDGITVREFGGGAGHLIRPARGATAAEGPWESWGYGHERISRSGGGFARSRDEGTLEQFSASGRLERLQHGRSSVRLTYSPEGHLAAALGDGWTVAFTTDSHGRVTSAKSSGGKSVAYEYDARGELTRVSGPGAANTTYRYANEAGVAQRLTGATYADGTSLELSYYGREGKGRIRSVKDRQGHLKRYRFETDPKNPLHRTVIVESEGEPARSYDYLYAHAPVGGELLRKLSVLVGKELSEREFDDEARPIRVHEGDEDVRMAYDASGRLVKRWVEGESVELSYDGSSERVSESVRTIQGGKPVRFSFGYDEKGRIALARGPGGREVKLLYDSSGRLRAVGDQAGRKVEYLYGPSGLVGFKDSKLGDLKPSSPGREELGRWLESLRPLMIPANAPLPF